MYILEEIRGEGVLVKYAVLEYVGTLEMEVQKINNTIIEAPLGLSIKEFKSKQTEDILKFLKNFIPNHEKFYYQVETDVANYNPICQHHFITTCCIKIKVYEKDFNTGNLGKSLNG